MHELEERSALVNPKSQKKKKKSQITPTSKGMGLSARRSGGVAAVPVVTLLMWSSGEQGSPRHHLDTSEAENNRSCCVVFLAIPYLKVRTKHYRHGAAAYHPATCRVLCIASLHWWVSPSTDTLRAKYHSRKLAIADQFK